MKSFFIVSCLSTCFGKKEAYFVNLITADEDLDHLSVDVESGVFAII